MSVRENFAGIYLRGMRDRTMRSGTELAREIHLTDWSTAGTCLTGPGVHIPRDICTRFGHYLYSTKCSWIISHFTVVCLVTWPLNGSEVGSDLALIQTSYLSSFSAN